MTPKYITQAVRDCKLCRGPTVCFVARPNHGNSNTATIQRSKKYCKVSSWHCTDSQTLNRQLQCSFHLICIFLECGMGLANPGPRYVGRKTLLNPAHILTQQKTKHYIPLNQLELPAVPESTCLLLSESPPCCLYLGEIASQQALSVVLCGFLRAPEPVGGSTPAKQTIANAPIDSAILPVFEVAMDMSSIPQALFYHIHHSVVSPHSLCDERKLWDESTGAFKDTQVFG